MLKTHGVPALAVLVPTVVFIGVQMQSGLGWPVDLVLAVLFAAFVTAVFAAGGWGVATLLRRLAPGRVSIGFGAIRYARNHGLRRPRAVVSLAAATAFAVATVYWLINPGAGPTVANAVATAPTARYSPRSI